MIDRIRRRQMAELLRHLASGQISVQDFESEVEDIALATNDLAVRWAPAVTLPDKDAVWWKAQRFRGPSRLSKERRRRYATTIAFLHSDEEYAWAPFKFDYYADFGMLLATMIMLIASAFLTAASIAFVYPWPIAILAVYSVVHLYRKSRSLLKAATDEWRSAADFSIFPFVSRETFERFRCQPRLLAGIRS